MAGLTFCEAIPRYESDDDIALGPPDDDGGGAAADETAKYWLLGPLALRETGLGRAFVCKEFASAFS